MKKLSLKKSRRLVWFTWLGVLVMEGVAIFAINSAQWFVLVLALLAIFWVVIRFFRKSKAIPKMRYSVVPSLFLPSAFFSSIITLLLICKTSGEMNLLAIEVGAMSIIFWILSIPESRY